MNILETLPKSVPPNFLDNYCLLLVDSDTKSLLHLKQQFSKYSPSLEFAGDLRTAEHRIQNRSIHAIIASWKGEKAMLSLMKLFFEHNPFGLFYFFMSNQFRADAVNLIRLGATDCLFEPLSIPVLSSDLKSKLEKRIFQISELNSEYQELQKHLLFRSEVMKRGLSMLPRVAETNYSVLITGETGTGKELVSQAIHQLSSRKEEPFIAVNCGAIQETLIESELFGHEKGAFTGATNTKKGKFELANHGTIFLDEIGEMPINSQVRLLRILEDGVLTRVGSEKGVRIDVRVLAATRVDLEEAIEAKIFREDLYYRLNILHIHLPPLRERKEDISLLAIYFFHRALKEMKRNPPFPYFSEEAISFLESLDWEGNVRQLRNILTRLAVLLPSDIRIINKEQLHALMIEFKGQNISAKEELYLQNNEAENGIFIPYGTSLEEVEKRVIADSLKRNQNNRTKTALELGISVRNLRRKLNSGV